MSFSSDIKQELSKLNCLNDKEAVKLELIGYLISRNTNIQNNKIKFATESEYNINRFAKLLDNMKIEKYKIEIQGKLYYITLKKEKIEEIKINEDHILTEELIQKQEKQRAIIRGIFLGSGSINNPQKKYHLEISINNEKDADIIKEILKKSNIKVKDMKKENETILYLKEGEEISKFLAYIEANKAVLNFEEIRVQREMNNKINRLANCTTANISKTINASVEQIEAIKKIKEKGEFDKLDENLKEIANARIQYPDISLVELGKKLSKPIGKSGANYRMKKIIEIAKNTRTKS